MGVEQNSENTVTLNIEMKQELEKWSMTTVDQMAMTQEWLSYEVRKEQWSGHKSSKCGHRNQKVSGILKRFLIKPWLQ